MNGPKRCLFAQKNTKMNIISKKILFDYFDGKHSSIQRKMIEEWLKTPQNEELFYQFLNEWESQHPQYLVETERGLTKVNELINQKQIEKPTLEEETKSFGLIKYFRWLAAAMIFMAIGWLGLSYYNKPNEISYESLVQNTKDLTGEIYEKENTTNTPMLVVLPDGSSVILQPNGKLGYSPTQYGKNNREIILSGEAFFEVQKNPNSPFFVYANELITKVLGTSFTIRANPSSSKTEVIVKTGKVAVFMQNDIDKKSKLSDIKLDGLILTPNQQISLDRTNPKIEKPAMVKEEQLNIPIQKLSFEFEDAPVVEVLEELKKAYNVKIIYDKDKLSNCRLTAHLADEPLYEKIKLICFALEIDYEETDGGILIKSNGCK